MQWELWRQDDHGNEFLVGTFDDSRSAEAARDEFRARGHHQDYWVKPQLHDGGSSRQGNAVEPSDRLPAQDGWRGLLHAIGAQLELRPGCEAAELDNAERALEIVIPLELREFLAATNGLYDSASQHAYGWRLQRVVSENTGAWSDDRMALGRDLVAFGDDGAGDWFCLPLTPGSGTEVIHWRWIGQERRTLAPNLREFWLGRYDGSITV
jgi:SMI1-KNR4 cell-wall